MEQEEQKFTLDELAKAAKTANEIAAQMGVEFAEASEAAALIVGFTKIGIRVGEENASEEGYISLDDLRDILERYCDNAGVILKAISAEAFAMTRSIPITPRKSEDSSAAKCPKSDRCVFGIRCPHAYEPPDKWYGCFARGKPKSRLEDFSRADLIDIVKFAADYSSSSRAALEAGVMQLTKSGRKAGKKI